nr:response regulator [Paenibacillus artemisiicola]
MADDEPYILEALKIGIPWEKYGFTVCGTAGDGQSAFETIVKLRPDLVFTDIKMPCSDGLELTSRIKERFPETICIIISGYAEFEYARTAISFGVDGYSLKPIEEEEIIEHLRKSNELLMNRSKAKTNEYFLDVIENNDKGTFNEKFASDKTWFILSNGGRMTALEHRSGVIYCKIAKKQWLYLTDAPYSEESLDKFAGEEVLGVGVLEYDRHTSELAACVNEVVIRSYGYFMTARGRVRLAQYNENEIRRYQWTLGYLAQQVQHKDAAAAEQTLKALSAMMETVSIAEMTRSFRVLEVLSGHEAENTDDECLAEGGMSLLAEKWESGRAFLAYFQEAIRSLLYPASSKAARYPANALISDVLFYLREHSKETIKLDDLSARFHINQAYLSKLFKKEIGVTPAKYMTQLKMEKACSLLAGTNLSINDVAQEVGYEDYLYFRKVFKNTLGITPSAFRGKQIPPMKSLVKL